MPARISYILGSALRSPEGGGRFETVIVELKRQKNGEYWVVKNGVKLLKIPGSQDELFSVADKHLQSISSSARGAYHPRQHHRAGFAAFPDLRVFFSFIKKVFTALLRTAKRLFRPHDAQKQGIFDGFFMKYTGIPQDIPDKILEANERNDALKKKLSDVHKEYGIPDKITPTADTHPQSTPFPVSDAKIRDQHHEAGFAAFPAGNESSRRDPKNPTKAELFRMFSRTPGFAKLDKKYSDGKSFYTVLRMAAKLQDAGAIIQAFEKKVKVKIDDPKRLHGARTNVFADIEIVLAGERYLVEVKGGYDAQSIISDFFSADKYRQFNRYKLVYEKNGYSGVILAIDATHPSYPAETMIPCPECDGFYMFFAGGYAAPNSAGGTNEAGGKELKSTELIIHEMNSVINSLQKANNISLPGTSFNDLVVAQKHVIDLAQRVERIISELQKMPKRVPQRKLMHLLSSGELTSLKHDMTRDLSRARLGESDAVARRFLEHLKAAREHIIMVERMIGNGRARFYEFKLEVNREDGKVNTLMGALLRIIINKTPAGMYSVNISIAADNMQSVDFLAQGYYRTIQKAAEESAKGFVGEIEGLLMDQYPVDVAARLSKTIADKVWVCVKKIVPEMVRPDGPVLLKEGYARIGNIWFIRANLPVDFENQLPIKPGQIAVRMEGLGLSEYFFIEWAYNRNTISMLLMLQKLKERSSEIFGKEFSNVTVVDAGAGPGTLGITAALLGARVIAVENNNTINEIRGQRRVVLEDHVINAGRNIGKVNQRTDLKHPIEFKEADITDAVTLKSLPGNIDIVLINMDNFGYKEALQMIRARPDIRYLAVTGGKFDDERYEYMTKKDGNGFVDALMPDIRIDRVENINCSYEHCPVILYKITPKKKDIAVLDIGSGDGSGRWGAGASHESIALSVRDNVPGADGDSTKVSIIGIDDQPSWVMRGRYNGLNIRQMSLKDRLDFPDASFDVVTCYNPDGGFYDIQSCITEVKRILKPGGEFWVAPYDIFANILKNPEFIPLFVAPFESIMRSNGFSIEYRQAHGQVVLVGRLKPTTTPGVAEVPQPVLPPAIDNIFSQALILGQGMINTLPKERDEATQEVKGKALVLYADDILECGTAADLAYTIKETSVLNGSTIILYGRKPGRAKLLEKIIKAGDPDNKVNVIPLLVEELQCLNRGKDINIEYDFLDEAKELESILTYVHRRGYLGIDNESLLGVIKGKAKKDCLAGIEDVAKDSHTPIVLFEHIETNIEGKEVYSFKQALALLISASNDPTPLKNREWFRWLRPIQKEEIEKAYQDYRRALEAAINA